MQLGLLLSVTLLACSGRGTDSGSTNSVWVGPAVDLGTSLATGTGFEFGNGSGAWLAAEHIVPDIAHTMPATDISSILWNMVQGANIADEGSCPYITASGNTLTWKSDCRSQDGYEWTGQLSETQWTDESGRWRQWTMDLEVIGDTDDPSFERMTLRGDFVDLTADGIEGLERAVHANLRAGVDGYWEQQSVASDKEAAWADYVVTGRWERRSDGTSRMEGLMDLGEYQGLHFLGESLRYQSSCTGEPAGTLVLTSNQTATLEFQGVAGCDRCADFSLDGVFAGQACGN